MINGNGSIHLLGSQPPKKDEQGRTLTHNCTVQEAHEIAHEQVKKVTEFYMNQVPNLLAQMVHAQLVHYGVIPAVIATPEAPVVSGNAAGDSADPVTIAAEGPSGLIDTEADAT